MLEEHFQIYGVQITEKKYLQVTKTESRHSCSCPPLHPQAKLSPRFLLSPPRQREITHSPGSVFSKMYFPSAE